MHFLEERPSGESLDKHIHKLKDDAFPLIQNSLFLLDKQPQNLNFLHKKTPKSYSLDLLLAGLKLKEKKIFKEHFSFEQKDEKSNSFNINDIENEISFSFRFTDNPDMYCIESQKTDSLFLDLPGLPLEKYPNPPLLKL